MNDPDNHTGMIEIEMIETKMIEIGVIDDKLS